MAPDWILGPTIAQTDSGAETVRALQLAVGSEIVESGDTMLPRGRIGGTRGTWRPLLYAQLLLLWSGLVGRGGTQTRNDAPILMCSRLVD